MVYVYDVTNPSSFGSVREWASQVCEQNGRDVPGALIANKCDLSERRKVSPEQGMDLAQQLGVEFFEMSSMPMHGGAEPESSAFDHLARSFFDCYKDRKQQIYEMQE